MTKTVGEDLWGTDLVYSWHNLRIGEEYFEVRDAEVGDPNTLRGTCPA